MITYRQGHKSITVKNGTDAAFQIGTRQTSVAPAVLPFITLDNLGRAIFLSDQITQLRGGDIDIGLQFDQIVFQTRDFSYQFFQTADLLQFDIQGIDLHLLLIPKRYFRCNLSLQIRDLFFLGLDFCSLDGGETLIFFFLRLGLVALMQCVLQFGFTLVVAQIFLLLTG